MNDRSSKITIGGRKYSLLLTVGATKEITKRYGGLDKLGEKIYEKELDGQLEEILWLITLLANQSIMRSNLLNGEKEPLLAEEALEVLTTPAELAGYSEAIAEALNKGTQRNVLSEDDPKNTEVG